MHNYNTTKACCLVCKREISTHGLHTHYERSHGTEEQKKKYSSGNNGKYEQISANIKLKHENYIPTTFCKNCNKGLPLSKKANIFCSRSCAATFNNKQRDPEIYQKIFKTRILPTPWNKDIKYKSNHKSPMCYVSFCEICSATIQNKINKTCSKKCLAKLLSNNSRKNPNCGGKRNSKRIYVKDSNQKIVCLESSYEVLLSEILNNLKIHWTRPKHIFYKKDNKTYRYYPDFYLKDFNIYLDPKNDYLIENCWDKIYTVNAYNNTSIVILDKKSLNADFIKDFLYMVDPSEFESDLINCKSIVLPIDTIGPK